MMKDERLFQFLRENQPAVPPPKSGERQAILEAIGKDENSRKFWMSVPPVFKWAPGVAVAAALLVMLWTGTSQYRTLSPEAGLEGLFSTTFESFDLEESVESETVTEEDWFLLAEMSGG